MDVRMGGEGRRKTVTRNNITALNAVWMGWRERQPGPGDGVRV